MLYFAMEITVDSDRSLKFGKMQGTEALNESEMLGKVSIFLGEVRYILAAVQIPDRSL
jgi:hypothetical protein